MAFLPVDAERLMTDMLKSDRPSCRGLPSLAFQFGPRTTIARRRLKVSPLGLQSFVLPASGNHQHSLQQQQQHLHQHQGGASGHQNSGGITVTQVIQHLGNGSSSDSSPVSSPLPPLSPSATTNCCGGTGWQSSVKCSGGVRERNAAMFNNDLMADVHFTVGPKGGGTQRIPAHTYVLATGSTVFYAMFYGGLADDRQAANIDIPDVEPAAFLTMLRYLYCDDINLEADTVLATLYAAKKYMVPNLARACVAFLETSLTARNACLLLSQSRLFEEPELMQRCWEVIDAQAEMALGSDGFVDIDIHTLESVLARETLNIKEVVLFEATLCWAGAECARRDLDPTADNRRKVLDRALYLVRVPAMSLEEFANGAAQSGVLTLQETTDIFLHFTAASKPTLPFPIRPRTGLKPQVCHRFQSSAYRSNQWRYRGRCDSIQFCVDKRIFVVGFGLYGSSNGSADYTVKIELKRLGRVLAEHTSKFYSDGSSNTFHVYFEHPIQIEAETFYTASAVLDGAELSYFGQEGLSEVGVGNVAFQFQCSSDSTNGTGVQGGQIPELIFYGPSAAAQQQQPSSSLPSVQTVPTVTSGSL